MGLAFMFFLMCPVTGREIWLRVWMSDAHSPDVIEFPEMFELGQRHR